MNKEERKKEKIDMIANKMELNLKVLLDVVEAFSLDIPTPKGLHDCFESFCSEMGKAAFYKLILTIKRHKDEKFVEEFFNLLNDELKEAGVNLLKEYEEWEKDKKKGLH